MNGVSGGTVQRVTFRPIAEVSADTTLNLGDLRIDPYAESLEISVDVMWHFQVTSSAVNTIGFSVYVYGGADGQVLGVATPRLYAKPTLASGVSAARFGTLVIGQHQSVKMNPYVSGNASTVTWKNADVPTYVHGGIPVNSWAVDLAGLKPSARRCSSQDVRITPGPFPMCSEAARARSIQRP